MRYIHYTACAAAVLASSGCAVNVREEVASAFAVAPDWFNARAEEVKGEGYPDIRQTPTAPAVTASDEIWRAEVEALELAGEAVEADPKAARLDPSTREDPSEWARRMRARVDAGASDIEADAAIPEAPE